MNRNSDWSWKPDKPSPPKPQKPKGKRKGGSKKKHRKKAWYKNSDNFYASKKWRELRVKVIERYGAKCMMCGRSPKEHGIVIHVDHIIARSVRPDLQLVFDNLQLLCEDCNLGKSNNYQTDWRPDDKQELEIVREAEKHLGPI